MRFPWTLGIIALSVGVAAAHPEIAWKLYDQLYPGDEAKRQALDLCFMENRKFNRLDRDERESCYRQHLPSPSTPVSAAALVSPALAHANFVDLWRASGQGHLAKNDIRSEQRNQAYTRSWNTH